MTEPEFVTVEELVRHRLMTALGGVWGSIETTVPALGFVVVWLTVHELGPALWTAGGAAVLVGVLRLVRDGVNLKNLRYVATGVAGVAIAAIVALRTGRAEDVFLPGILLSVAYLVGVLVSVLVGWPLVGFLVGAADPMAREDPLAWHRHPEVVRVSTRLTWVLAADYAIRVGVMLPLYFAGAVGWLGVAKIVLGWPLWAAVVAVMGAILVRGNTPYVPLPGQEPPTFEDLAEAEGA